MAIRQAPGSEEDILAMLDHMSWCTLQLRKYCVAVGCDPPALQPVAGSGMKGIGGKMKLAGQRTLELSFELENGDYARGTMTSLEIEDSDAPLLLLIGTQRQLGFVIDLNKKKVSSDILGSNVKVVNRGGLMAIPLIPGYLGLHAEAASHDYEMTEPQYQNVYETQNVKMTPYDTVKKAEVETSTEPELAEEEIALCPEARLALDEISSKKTFTKGQRRRITAEVKEIKKADRRLWGTLRSGLNRPRILPKGCRAFLFEIFAGTAMLSMMAADAGYIVSQPCDILLDGSNLLNASHRAKIEEVINSDDPYCVSFSPVCGPWSPTQQLSVAKDADYAPRLEALRQLWYPVCKLMDGEDHPTTCCPRTTSDLRTALAFQDVEHLGTSTPLG